MEKLKTVGALFRFIFARRKYWLLPVVLVLIITAVLLFVFAGSSITPFIYTIF